MTEFLLWGWRTQSPGCDLSLVSGEALPSGPARPCRSPPWVCLVHAHGGSHLSHPASPRPWREARWLGPCCTCTVVLTGVSASGCQLNMGVIGFDFVMS